MSIDWNEIGNAEFNILDPLCGWWTEDGFTNNQHNAKTYTSSNLSDQQRAVISSHRCSIWSA